MNQDSRRPPEARDPRAIDLDDASIPVLTEKLILPTLELDVSLPAPIQPIEPGPAAPALEEEVKLPTEPEAEPSAATSTDPAAEALLVEAQAPLAPPEIEFRPAPAPTGFAAEALATRVRDEAIARLAAELAPALEAEVRARVAAAIDDALLDMLALLQVSLESQIRAAVTEAVEHQLDAARAAALEPRPPH